jgi:type II secretory ATPase GspE/PulE/Tfp pilus assembly ATPase PilB-like protein
VDAAASGRVVLSTLHSRDATGAVTSLRNWELEDHEICTTLAVAVAQRLVRTLCPDCRRLESPRRDELRWLRAMGIPSPEKVWHAVGCASCGELGYRGRTAVFEVWRLDEQDYELILAHTDERTLRRQLADRGHAFLLNDALAKARSGITTLDELRTMGGFGPAGPSTLRGQDVRGHDGERSTVRTGSSADGT